jgi:two-component system phosphate regulon sensor histidine kinase PhoR
VENLIKPKLLEGKGAEVEEMLKEMGPSISTRVTVTSPTGEAVGDSQLNLANVGNLARRPEIKDALKGNVGTAGRFSLAANERVLFFALPVKQADNVIGVVRVAAPATSPSSILRESFEQIIWVATCLVLLAVLTALCVAYVINRRLAEMSRAADRFGEGDLHLGIDVPNSEELGSLAVSMNRMAAQLHQRLNSITRQKNELEAVLSAMVEAVILVDTHGRILQLNQAAEKLFQISEEKMRGRTLQEGIRHTDLHRFVSLTLAGPAPIEADIVFIGDPDKFLQAHGVPLKDAQDQRIGALVVLNDVTRLRVLEKIRRDFVANVSHELKTPITSIKGFLETLKEGGINDPENAERFLTIIIKHTDRLSMIIEDLLSLSRIETDSEKGEIVLEEGPVQDVLEAVGKACHKKAEAKNITLEYDIDRGLVARINPTLLEQAVMNLVDNAVKYSEPESVVKVEARKVADEVIITVRDHGCGIPKEHLDRIFERFYRVDRARSRKVGGTGLGLAIVRHIVNAHNATITVESSPGRGSAFSIHLPA